MSKARDIADSASIINYLDGLTTGLADSPTFTGTVTAAALAVDTDVLLVDDTNNRVGVNVASPAYELDIDGNIKVSQGLIFGDSTGYLYEGATDQINFRIGADGPYVTFKDVGSSVAEFGNASGALAIKTGASERMRIDASGNVGIGTSTPSSILTAVTSSNANNIQIRRDSTTTNDYAQLGFSVSTGTTAANNAEIRAIRTNSPNGGDTAIAFLNRGAGIGPTERMRIESDGDIDLGDFSSSNYAWIRPYEATTGNMLIGADNGATGTGGSAMIFRLRGSEKMRITHSGTSGNVGIGTSNPISYANGQTTLVVEDTTGPAIAWSDTGQARDWFAIAQGTGLNFRYADGGGAGSPSNVTDLLFLENTGNVRIGTTSGNASSRLVVSDADVQVQLKATSNSGFINFDGTNLQLSTNRDLKTGSFSDSAKSNAALFLRGTAGGSIVSFYTSPSNNTTATERMRIDSSGNIGIGTTAPSYKLDTYGAVASRGSGIGNAAFVLQEVGNNPWYITQFTGGSLGILYNGTSSANTKLAIDTSGNVSIGTATPISTSQLTINASSNTNIVLDGDNYTTWVQNSQWNSSLLGGAYYDSGVKYGITGRGASQMYIGHDGNASLNVQGFKFFAAAAGTAGDTPSFENLATFTREGTVFNEDGLDRDFRVESDGNTHALFVNAGNSRVGVGTSSPESALSVNGDILSNWSNSGQQKIGVAGRGSNLFSTTEKTLIITGADAVGGAQAMQGGDVIVRGGLGAGNEGLNIFAGNLYLEGGEHTNGAGVTSGAGKIVLKTAGYTRQEIFNSGGVVFNNDGYDADFRVESDTRSAMLFVDASTDRVGINTDAPQEILEVRGKVLIEANNAGLTDPNNELILSDSDTTTDTDQLMGRISFNTKDTSNPGTAAKIQTRATNTLGSGELQIWSGTAPTLAKNAMFRGDQVVFNEDSNDMDFRVESDSNTHAIYLDAGAFSGAGAIGFGVSSPQQYVHQANDTGRRLGGIVEWSGGLDDISDGATRTITLTGLGNYQSAMVEIWVAWRLNGGSEPATSRILITFYEGNNSVTDITVLEFSGKNIVQGDWTTTKGADFITFEITNTSWSGAGGFVAGQYYVKAFSSPAGATLTVG